MLPPDLATDDYAALRRHRELLTEDTTVTALRPYACPIPDCDRRFKRRFTLKEHVKTHTGEKSFVCPVPSCRKSFTTSGNLSRHKRLHPWLETSFECLIVGCDCTFSSEAKLERHMSMAHFGQSTHLCPHVHCGGAFSTAGNLKRHLRHHHSARAGEEASPRNASGSAEGSAAVGKRELCSPVAVDRFDGSIPHSTHGQVYTMVFAWDTPLPQPLPARSAILRPPVLAPPLLNDGDLLEALGYLFEPMPYVYGSAIV